MRAEIRQYQGKSKKILATANLITNDGIEIRGFMIIRSSIDETPVFYPPLRSVSNGRNYQVVSRSDEKWIEIEKILSDEFHKQYPKFKKKLKTQKE